MKLPPVTTDREIISSRVFNVSREKLWEAWTNPELLAKWWGPKGFTNTFKTFDLKPGGDWIFTMHGPTGVDYPNESKFVEITKPTQIIFDHVNKPHFKVNAKFEEVAGGKSKLIWSGLFASAAEFGPIKDFISNANEENLDRLEALLYS